MSAHAMKAVMYIYNESEATADLELDRSGSVVTPMGGAVLTRKGKHWEVVRTTILSAEGKMPVLKVYLTDHF